MKGCWKFYWINRKILTLLSHHKWNFFGQNMHYYKLIVFINHKTGTGSGDNKRKLKTQLQFLGRNCSKNSLSFRNCSISTRNVQIPSIFQSPFQPGWSDQLIMNSNTFNALEKFLECLSSFMKTRLPFLDVRTQFSSPFHFTLFILASLLHHFWSSIICTIICHIFQVDIVCANEG